MTEISRQRRWQIKQKSMGNCIICGKKVSSTNKNLCEKHRLLRNKRQRFKPS